MSESEPQFENGFLTKEWARQLLLVMNSAALDVIIFNYGNRRFTVLERTRTSTGEVNAPFHYLTASAVIEHLEHLGPRTRVLWCNEGKV